MGIMVYRLANLFHLHSSPCNGYARAFNFLSLDHSAHYGKSKISASHSLIQYSSSLISPNVLSSSNRMLSLRNAPVRLFECSVRSFSLIRNEYEAERKKTFAFATGGKSSKLDGRSFF